jgi:hypothetical protein
MMSSFTGSYPSSRCAFEQSHAMFRADALDEAHRRGAEDAFDHPRERARRGAGRG